MTLSPILVLTLDILGISLALLDFTGTARKAEERLRRISQRQKRRARIFFKWGFDFRNWKEQRTGFVNFWIGNTIIVAIYFLIMSVIERRPGFMSILPSFNDLSSMPIWAWVVIAFLSPIWSVAIYMLNGMIGTVMMAGTLVVFYRLFWLLSLPKAGVLGTLGLLLPITTATLNTLSLS